MGIAVEEGTMRGPIFLVTAPYLMSAYGKETYEELGLEVIVDGVAKLVLVKGDHDKCAEIHGEVYDSWSMPGKKTEAALAGKCISVNEQYRKVKKISISKEFNAMRMETCHSAEFFTLCSLKTNKLDPKSPRYHSRCGEKCSVKNDKKICTCKWRKLGDNRHSCIDDCTIVKCGADEGNFACQMTKAGNAFCPTHHPEGSNVFLLTDRRQIKIERFAKTVYSYLSPKVQVANIKTHVIDKLKGISGSFYERCIEKKCPNCCYIYDLFQGLETLVGLESQMAGRDNRIISSPEWKDVGLKAYLKELQQDLEEKSKHMTQEVDIAKLAKSLSGDGLGKYFKKVADFDIKTGEADIGFIKAELHRLKTGAAAELQQLNSKLKPVLKEAITLLAAEVAERIVDVALHVMQCFNPFALIAGNCDVAEIKGAIESLGDATRRLTKAKVLMDTLGQLFAKAKKISADFAKNEGQYGMMLTMVEALQNGNENLIRMESDRFARSYADYTPAVTSQDLAYMLARL